MKNKIKDILKKIVYKERASSDTYVEFLRKKGMSIGENVEIFNPRRTIIDEQYPWMIEIGDNVKITDGVIILTHDFSWSVIKNYNKCLGELLGASGKVVIGNNVFIGMNSIITRDVKIGDNVIIGVGSIVTKDCDSGYVYAGNPAKKISSLDEFINKRRNLQLNEARILAKEYRKKYLANPPIEVFSEYFMLFTDFEQASKNKKFLSQLKVGGTYYESMNFYENKHPHFNGYDDFIKYCYEK